MNNTNNKFPVKIILLPIVKDKGFYILCGSDFKPITLDLSGPPIKMIEEYIKQVYPTFSLSNSVAFLHKLTDNDNNSLSISYLISGLNYNMLDKNKCLKLKLELKDKDEFWQYNFKNNINL